MKKIVLCLCFILSLCVFISAQATTATEQASTTEKKTKKTTFRATKDQILEAQKILKVTETGKLSKEDKEVLKAYQTANGLKAKGSLNRATLEKMGIALTAKQKEIPVSPDSISKTDSEKSTKKKGPVFRASKEQIMQAQKVLKVAETGKLSKDDHEALKTYQQNNGIKPTGGLNKVTLEKMGIELTDKQKEM